MELAQLPQHGRLHHRHGNGAGQRNGIAGARCQREAQDVCVGLARAAVVMRRRQLGERDRHRGGCRGDQGVDQGLAAVVGGIEAVAGLREVDGNEAQRAAAGQRLEQGALMRQGAGKTVRQGSAWTPSRERIGQGVAGARRIALVQARLRHDHRPVGMRGVAPPG